MNQRNDRSVPFSEFLRRRRTALRLKQADIAAALHVEPESIGNWENGRRRMELDKIPRLAAILRVNANDLCRLALFEWHPRLYDTLFGADRPRSPREDAQQTGVSSRNLLPARAADGRLLEARVIVGHSLGEAEQLP